MAAAGRVITGFSLPWMATYNNSSGTITYTGAMQIARGVSVSLTPESEDNNVFYADNVAAESTSGRFTGGTATLTVDGLHPAARRMMSGLPAAGTDGWTADGDSTEPPYLGIGWITRYMSDGETIYVPMMLAKTKVSIPPEDAATQEEAIAWQTTALTVNLFRDDSAAHNWRFIGGDFETEEAALAALKTKLGVSP